MTILRSRAVPFAAALCLAFAAPAASNAAGYMYFKDTPIVGELPAAPGLAAPTQPGTPAADGDTDGRDFLIWRKHLGPNAAPKAVRPGTPKFQTPGQLKAK